ncbi:hypothetical protein [Streptomyces sp. NPDC126503]|uniref:hypothetical protein n=1 Tax=Streptomyces sp. NPDC126503 TaxID=3155315 RepID=UPI003332F754
MAEQDRPATRGINISNAHGNVSVGDNNQVSYTVHGAGAAARDPLQEELLTAIRALRADLGRLVATDETTVLEAELADAEDEIEGTGAAGRPRLARLRLALTDAGAVTGILASGVAVGQAVGALLGG